MAIFISLLGQPVASKVVRKANFIAISSLFVKTFKFNILRQCVRCLSSTKDEHFKPKTALILTKFSRYEFEKRRHPNLSEKELKENLADRGSDYSSLLHHHHTHTKYRDAVKEKLTENGIETRLVDRFDYTDQNIEWADVIFTTGGDGTFLMAASKIHDREKPVIGINSDPSRSVGYLCLPARYTFDFSHALEKLLSGKFKWTWRQRIRISVTGKNAFDTPIELHDQQLQYPEYRFIDCYHEEHIEEKDFSENKDSKATKHVLPVRALNEVFIGESLSSRTSYYELSVDKSTFTKQRSSGFTISTGTGSTSWHLNTNKMTRQDVQDLLSIIYNITGKSVSVDGRTISRITDTFNGSLIFDPSEQQMAYTIRDPQHFGMNEWDILPRGFANNVQVRSRCFDACLVIDGGLSFAFNDGATADFEICPEDALKTICLFEDDVSKPSQ